MLLHVVAAECREGESTAIDAPGLMHGLRLFQKHAVRAQQEGIPALSVRPCRLAQGS